MSKLENEQRFIPGNFRKLYRAIMEDDVELLQDMQRNTLSPDFDNSIIEYGENRVGINVLELEVIRGEPYKQVVGMVVVQKTHRGLYLPDITIDPNFRRAGLGTYLLDKVKLSVDPNLPYVEVFINERDLRALSFFKKGGFVANPVMTKDVFSDGDGVTMVYKRVEG